jgi:hypothetical protein
MKECAIYTLAHDEKYWLPLWYKYYSQYFSDEDIYIYNHKRAGVEGPDGTEGLTCNVIEVNDDSLMSTGFILDFYIKTHSELLERYKYVMSSDADEILVADPKVFDRGLNSYVEVLNIRNADIVRVTCFDVLHDRFNEPDIIWDEPILGHQRKRWINTETYNKVLISSVLPNWSSGRHYEIDNQDRVPDGYMFLIHFRRADYKSLKAKNEYNLETACCDNWYEKIVGDEFDQHFDDPCLYNCRTGSVKEIPKRFHGIM